MKRIALIEDDSDIAFTIRLNLEREGYTVIHFGRGQDALMAVQRGGFDFVILDLNLPEYDAEGMPRRTPKTIKVRIPKGVTDGQKLRVPGKGAPRITKACGLPVRPASAAASSSKLLTACSSTRKR